MSEEQDTDQEPSIEEILDSIRQIISDDDEEGAATGEEQDEAVEEPDPEEGPEPEPEPEEEPEPDVIELTDIVEPEPEEEPEPGPEPEEEPEPEPETEEIVEVDMQDVESDVEEDFESLLTNNAESAAFDAFSELAQKAEIERRGNITIEDVVRGELRPLLREWVDKNLPPLVERLLAEELERVSKRVLGD